MMGFDSKQSRAEEQRSSRGAAGQRSSGAAEEQQGSGAAEQQRSSGKIAAGLRFGAVQLIVSYSIRIDGQLPCDVFDLGITEL